MPSNESRADRGQTALRQYIEARGEVFENSSSEAADLIADLLHHIVRIEEDDDTVENTLRLAKMHFDAEQTELEEDEELNPPSP